jgi:quercetin dioxygenase-like cupin family protein
MLCVEAVYRMTLSLFALLLGLAADDPVKDPRVKIDNLSVRVLDVVDQPHNPSAKHKHDLNRVMIYLSPGDLTVRYDDGHVDEQHWKAWQGAWSPAGGMHISENVGDKPLRIIEVELKRPPTKAPRRDPKLDPVAIDPQHNILLFENLQVRVFRSWREPGGTEMMHSHAGAGRVGVYLTDVNATVKVRNGASTALHAKAGDVSWSGPVTHATTNLGPNKLEMIVVEVF